jgi:hypothetical protein
MILKNAKIGKSVAERERPNGKLGVRTMITVKTHQSLTISPVSSLTIKMMYA